MTSPNSPFSLIARQQDYYNPFAEVQVAEVQAKASESKDAHTEKLSSPTGLFERVRRITLGGRRKTIDKNILSQKNDRSEREKTISSSDAVELGKLLPNGSYHAVQIIDILLSSEAGQSELLSISKEGAFKENVDFLIIFNLFAKSKDINEKQSRYLQLQAIINNKDGLNSNVFADLSFGYPEKEKELRNSLQFSSKKELDDSMFLSSKVEAFKPIVDKIKSDIIHQLLPKLRQHYEAYLPKPESVSSSEMTSA